MNPKELPIFEIEAALVAALREKNRVVLQAPTGSGKSTQVPQMLLDHGLSADGEIVVLQPRRLAARMLAARVASERRCKLGGEVGYQIRFERHAGPQTRIRFVTEGILLREMLSDPRLPGVSAIVFDEFHERHLYGDITLARALDLQEQHRPDLRLIVMSATLDAAALETYLAPCATLRSEGRTFPVEARYLGESVRFDQTPVWEIAAQTFAKVADSCPGDALIFMPGTFEIQRTIASLRGSPAAKNCDILPLHGELPPAEQDMAVNRSDRRKIIVSTNVAETSLTIDGVRLVIDSGLARVARFDPFRGINTLLVERISRASCDQRAGRAGRTAPGVCVRLWTQQEHADRAAQELPEVRRLDLAEVLLTLLAGGVEDLAGFRWLEAPTPKSLERAITLLTDLSAIEKTPGGHRMTELGQRMLAFPVHPRYARMLLAADRYGCVKTVCLVAALTQGRPLLRRMDDKRAKSERDDLLEVSKASDFCTLLRAYQIAEESQFDPRRTEPLGINAGAAREASVLRKQFERIATGEGLTLENLDDSDEALAKCILAGFPDQVAAMIPPGGTLRCNLVHGRIGVLARESVVCDSPLFCASEIREIERGGERQVLLTNATAIKEEWLRELFPEAFVMNVTGLFDYGQKRVVAREVLSFHGMIIRQKDTANVPPDVAASIMADLVEKREYPIEEWNQNVDQWIERLNCLCAWMPDLELPPITAADRRTLLETICHGVMSVRELAGRAVWPTVKSWLSPMQLDLLDRYAPERIELAKGRKFRLEYAVGKQPVITARIQDFYDIENEVRIASGRVTCLIHICAPNRRPVQITSNLSTFWRESYPKLKLELQRKYPKHEWR